MYSLECEATVTEQINHHMFSILTSTSIVSSHHLKICRGCCGGDERTRSRAFKSAAFTSRHMYSLECEATVTEQINHHLNVLHPQVHLHRIHHHLCIMSYLLVAYMEVILTSFMSKRRNLVETS
ncbi:Uncharacterized protein Rs2_38677 [Raphanus sativus]|nr:Uncharacterized protein Rs2_38677 [Raphanus sativus]